LLLQVHPELRNLYTVHTEGLIHALMRESVSLLRQQQAPAAVEAAQQAFAVVQQLRCLPLLQAQAAALLGHCCTVHSHQISAPLAAGSLSSLSANVNLYPLPVHLLDCLSSMLRCCSVLVTGLVRFHVQALLAVSICKQNIPCYTGHCFS